MVVAVVSGPPTDQPPPGTPSRRRPGDGDAAGGHLTAHTWGDLEDDDAGKLFLGMAKALEEQEKKNGCLSLFVFVLAID